jgi:putative acetyltransferase
MHFQRTQATDTHFQQLIALLDQDLWARYKEEQAKFVTHNFMDLTARVIVAYKGEQAIGCGCFRPTEENGTVEIKRMFVQPEWRGKGIAAGVLKELENWAKEEHFNRAILETGNQQPEAIGLYHKACYSPTEKYGPYKDMPESVCMAKPLT